MQTLMILRHAKAVPYGSMPDDFSRPLNVDGTAHARAVADWIQENLAFPEMVLCSPSQRTRETLGPLVETIAELEQRTRFLPQLYGASVRTLINVLDHAFAECDSALVVGHNPGLEDLMFETTSPKESKDVKRLATGTLVVVELDPDWAEAQGRGKIAHKVRGKQLVE
jgi:phosphohistidine phosphatase SixA